MARTYESFYLVTVAHGRQGQIPYQYPPASANPEASTKLPPAKVGYIDRLTSYWTRLSDSVP